jgi:gamma-glutamylcyclotransferase (GGCT)/AIG2-like uncharacterized protein YtfP
MMGDVQLFSYGTLRLREVQVALFGRVLDGQADVLPGYAVVPLEITDPDVIAKSGSAQHTMVRETGNPRDEVPGTVFTITESELAAADAYEVADVRRVGARLKSGIQAYVYVAAR